MRKMICQFVAIAVILAGVAYTVHSSGHTSSNVSLEIGPGTDVVVNNPPTA